MRKSQLSNLAFYKRALQLIAIGNRGVQAAMRENTRKGLPNVFGIDDKIYYRMPDGTITMKSPFRKKKK